jgi:hypothetical protein
VGSIDLVLGRAAARALAAGFVPVAGQESVSVGTTTRAALTDDDRSAVSAGDVPQATLDALRRAIAREPTVTQAWLLSVVPVLEIGLVLRVPLDQAGLMIVATRLAGRVPASAGGLSVEVVEVPTGGEHGLPWLALWP